MKKRKIHITKPDLNKLQELLMTNGNTREREDLTELKEEVERAVVVESDKVPASLVTMNSQVKLVDMDTGEDMIFTLVFPQDASIDNGKISVLSPIGTAILGYAEGDTIAWKVPAGKSRIKIEKILYQPEAAGDINT